MQTRKVSIIESWANVVFGWTLNYVMNLLIFPLFNMHISLRNNLVMGSIYTGISVIRSYCIRRWFNKREQQ